MKIILADDSITMRRIEVNALNALGYNDIIQVESGVEVLEKLTAHPDTKLVLLDWNMPFMDGLDCLKAIKANPDTRHLPVIMVTSEATRERIVEAIQSGATNYLVKPFELEKLQNAVSKLLS